MNPPAEYFYLLLVLDFPILSKNYSEEFSEFCKSSIFTKSPMTTDEFHQIHQSIREMIDQFLSDLEDALANQTLELEKERKEAVLVEYAVTEVEYENIETEFIWKYDKMAIEVADRQKKIWDLECETRKNGYLFRNRHLFTKLAEGVVFWIEETYHIECTSPFKK